VGFSFGARRLLFAAGHAAGRIEGGAACNLLVGGDLRFDARNLGHQLFHVGLELDVAHRLDGENQLLLGGDSGLRGYPLRFQEGDRRVLVTVEQRVYFPWDVLKLFRLGAAVFFDAGEAWFADEDRPEELGLLKDVGLGLRIDSTRSGRRHIVHLDVAYPLDGPPSRRSVQWLVTTEESF
jgi:hemolysin activation/secretion protein